MKRIFEVSINRLTDILSHYFKEDIMIEIIHVASTEKQHSPESKSVGIGGVLTLVCSTKGKKRGR